MTHIVSPLRIAAIIAWAVGLASCAAPPAPPAPAVPPRVPAVRPAPTPIEPSALPGWSDDSLEGLSSALGRQCGLRTPPGAWPRLCKEWSALPTEPQALRRWLLQNFQAWQLRNDQQGEEGLITGYYEPLLTGSRQRESARQTPLYARPGDLLTIDLASVEPRLQGLRLRGRLQGQRVVPYYPRSEIETREPLRGTELVWVDDRVDAFFLEIQGSGRIQLRDGTLMRVGYADQNGHPYRPIGRTLIERGALRVNEVSAPIIRRWLRDNPSQASDVLHSNPSVVFFRELPAAPTPRPGEPEAGPPGALGVPLTALRSVAVDRRVVPLASLVWLDTRHPLNGQPLQRLMTDQDVGGAIAGQIRADVFWGFGEVAERAAGEMQATGRMWVLWLHCLLLWSLQLLPSWQEDLFPWSWRTFSVPWRASWPSLCWRRAVPS